MANFTGRYHASNSFVYTVNVDLLPGTHTVELFGALGPQ
jgi:hypothetical protein